MDDLPRLITEYARSTGLAISTVCRKSGGQADVMVRAQSGRITFARAARVTQWLSNHWPDDLEWPLDIPRPAPRRPAA